MREFKDLKIAVAGTGYVGLSIATLLSQHHQVTAVDIIPEKVDLITIIASGLYSITNLITASTAEVSKKFFLLS